MKFKDIKNLNKEDREKRLAELKLELMKTKAGASKGGTSRIKEIKKIIARILTFNNSTKNEKLNTK